MPPAEKTSQSQRIVLVLTKLGIGGAESQVRDLALAFRRQGLLVDVVSLRRPEAHLEVLQANGVPVHSLGMESAAGFFPALFKMAGLLRRLRPSVVHAHCYHANIFCRLARLVAPSAVLVCTAHSTYEVSRKKGHSSRALRDAVYRLTDRLSHYNTHVSQQGFERYVSDGLFRIANSSHVPNGIDFPDAVSVQRRRAVREKVGWDASAFVWLHAGRMSRAKNQRLLLEAFANAAEKRPNALLAMAGGGELEQELKDCARRWKLDGRVQFLGFREDVPELMAGADAFVMSSDWEGLPIVLLEAAAAGLPCVATRVGSIPDVLGEAGWLVPSGDAGLLAQAMQECMDMPGELLRNRGEALRAHARDRFSMDRIVQEWLIIYQRVVAKSKR